MNQDTVDCVFNCVVAGSVVRVDHGYQLYSAICSMLGPQVHGSDWLGVHPLSGRMLGDELVLETQTALRLRIPAAMIPMVLPLAGSRMRVGDCALQVGTPTVHALYPAASLDARQVLVKVTAPARAPSGRLDMADLASRVSAELTRQLAEMSVEGQVALLGRRVLDVKGKRLQGFAVRVSSLSVEHSLILQARGLGGKRAMGCGIFRPTRGGVQ